MTFDGSWQQWNDWHGQKTSFSEKSKRAVLHMCYSGQHNDERAGCRARNQSTKIKVYVGDSDGSVDEGLTGSETSPDVSRR